MKYLSEKSNEGYENEERNVDSQKAIISAQAQYVYTYIYKPFWGFMTPIVLQMLHCMW
jgi:hypothetical protein